MPKTNIFASDSHLWHKKVDFVPLRSYKDAINVPVEIES